MSCVNCLKLHKQLKTKNENVSCLKKILTPLEKLKKSTSRDFTKEEVIVALSTFYTEIDSLINNSNNHLADNSSFTESISS